MSEPIQLRAVEVFPEPGSDADFPRRWFVNGINVDGAHFDAPTLGAALASVAQTLESMVDGRSPVEIEIIWGDPFRDEQLMRCEFVPGGLRWFGLGRLLGLRPIIQSRSLTNLE